MRNAPKGSKVVYNTETQQYVLKAGKVKSKKESTKDANGFIKVSNGITKKKAVKPNSVVKSENVFKELGSDSEDDSSSTPKAQSGEWAKVVKKRR